MLVVGETFGSSLSGLMSIGGGRNGSMYCRTGFGRGWEGRLGIGGRLMGRMLALCALFLFIMGFSSILGRRYLLGALHLRRLTFVV